MYEGENGRKIRHHRYPQHLYLICSHAFSASWSEYSSELPSAWRGRLVERQIGGGRIAPIRGAADALASWRHDFMLEPVPLAPQLRSSPRSIQQFRSSTAA